MNQSTTTYNDNGTDHTHDCQTIEYEFPSIAVMQYYPNDVGRHKATNLQVMKNSSLFNFEKSISLCLHGCPYKRSHNIECVLQPESKQPWLKQCWESTVLVQILLLSELQSNRLRHLKKNQYLYTNSKESKKFRIFNNHRRRPMVLWPRKSPIKRLNWVKLFCHHKFASICHRESESEHFPKSTTTKLLLAAPVTTDKDHDYRWSKKQCAR